MTSPLASKPSSTHTISQFLQEQIKEWFWPSIFDEVASSKGSAWGARSAPHPVSPSRGGQAGVGCGHEASVPPPGGLSTGQRECPHSIVSGFLQDRVRRKWLQSHMLSCPSYCVGHADQPRCIVGRGWRRSEFQDGGSSEAWLPQGPRGAESLQPDRFL